MILFMDTETTGMVDFKLRSEDPAQPHLVQLAMLLAEPDGTERAAMNLVIRPEGWTISDEAIAIHGITQETAELVGIDLGLALALFTQFLDMADLLVAHSFNYDRKVLSAALHRALPGPHQQRIREIDGYCTMIKATKVCKIPHANGRGFKWPKLEECMQHFFGEELAGAHDALVDVKACKRVYFALQQEAA